jgi:hypothetical protein
MALACSFVAAYESGDPYLEEAINNTPIDDLLAEIRELGMVR